MSLLPVSYLSVAQYGKRIFRCIRILEHILRYQLLSPQYGYMILQPSQSLEDSHLLISVSGVSYVDEDVNNNCSHSRKLRCLTIALDDIRS